ncbi:MAG: ATP-binding protein [Alphaproteobacteria bacterium]|jgi:signal transduction histidine kinase|nr:ATP-binding protein [Alphaproteobacteria bacterium]MDP6814034.1 ATP-binding protein [Alphaproteobacteria bacterium]
MVDTIFRNLISNALKFTPEGGQVSLVCGRDGDWVEVGVSDTGVGIPPDRLAALFDLGQTASTSGTSGEVGTGLGLHFCRELVSRHGGDLRVESTPGQRTVFSFTLPVAE